MPETFRRISDSLPPDSEQFDLRMGYVMERVEALRERVEGMDSRMTAAVSSGVQQGIKALAADPEFGEAFWRRGFEQMSTHATKAGSQWVGSRILTALVLAVLSGCIAWLVKSGKL